jgi:Flp pilus assembly protein TadG
MVEFAIAAPLLIVLVLGIADYGLLMGSSAALEGATRAGAEFGKANPSVTAYQLTTLNLFPSKVTPTVTSVCTCVDNTWPTGAACPPGPLTTPCRGATSPFASGSTVDPRVFEYVQVAATQSVSQVFSSAKSVSANTTIRTQ